MNRILFYVHYNKDSEVHAHVLYQLSKIRSIFDRMILISNSPLSSSQSKELSLHVDSIIERANCGYDFFAWKEALDIIGESMLADYDSVTLMNDTCFGPLFSLEEAYASMEETGCDFWGITNHRSGNDVIPELGIAIPEHVQSYFIAFKSTVINSSAWKEFWGGMACESNVYKVIAKYETQLTTLLCDAGFNYGVLLDTVRLELLPSELSYTPAHICIGERLPLLKIKSLLQHKNPRHIIRQICQQSDYPTELIETYISKSLPPDKSLPYCDKVINTYVTNPSAYNLPNAGSVAAHIHVYYLDVWEKYAEHLRAFNFPIDLYITTDSERKAVEIRATLENPVQARATLKEIAVLPNRGRDILPWLAISERLRDYNAVLHAHTKKSPTASEWVGSSWQQDIFDTMLDKAPSILDAFHRNSELGVVIPDVPSYWRQVAPIRQQAEVGFIDMMRHLWNAMGCRRDPDFDHAAAFIVPYGTMFWYRPRALEKITALALTYKDVPNEPLPEKTALHALERLVVYVAWDAGFDYRIVPPKEIVSGFSDGIARAKLFPATLHATSHKMDAQATSLLRRAANKLRTMRLKRLILMLMPYGLVRLYQKRSEYRVLTKLQMAWFSRTKSQGHGENVLSASLQTPELRASFGPKQKFEDYWLRPHRHLHSLNIVNDAASERRLNLVISSLGRTQLFGGIATCIVVATTLARALGLPLRIIARDGEATKTQYDEITSTLGIEPFSNVSFYSDHNRDTVGKNSQPLYVSNNDVFLASSWWTATVLRRSVPPQNVYHIIQEDELMFYQRGDDYLDCWKALNSPDSKYIVNSKYLQTWFKDSYPKIYANSAVFEPVFKQRQDRKFEKKTKYNLFFYARTTNPRNLFWFGLRVLADCLSEGILDPEEWNIFLAGDDSIPHVELSKGKTAVNLGILSWEEYKELLSEVDLGLCLIHTPHPGYPVYDVASSGGVAVTNTLYTKAAFPCSDNIIACELTDDDFRSGMKRAVALAKDLSVREQNYLRQTIPDSWDKSLADVVDYVKANSGLGNQPAP